MNGELMEQVIQGIQTDSCFPPASSSPPLCKHKMSSHDHSIRPHSPICLPPEAARLGDWQQPLLLPLCLYLCRTFSLQFHLIVSHILTLGVYLFCSI